MTILILLLTSVCFHGCSNNSKGTCTCTCETRPVSATENQVKQPHSKASLIRTATRMDAPLEQQGAAASSAAAAAGDGGKKGDETAVSGTAASDGTTGGVDQSMASNELPLADAWETRQLLNRCVG